MMGTMAPTIPTIYKQHRLESWDEFLKIITGSPYSPWAFRGHRKSACPLATLDQPQRQAASSLGVRCF
jgi:hypothetical protein